MWVMQLQAVSKDKIGGAFMKPEHVRDHGSSIK